MLLIDFGRELGLPLRGLYAGQHFGWTTGKAKAETMRGQRYLFSLDQGEDEAPLVVERSVHVESVPSRDPRPEARRFDGWEISFPVGADTDGAERFTEQDA